MLIILVSALFKIKDKHIGTACSIEPVSLDLSLKYQKVLGITNCHFKVFPGTIEHCE